MSIESQAETAILIAEIEQLAQVVAQVRGIDADKLYYHLPYWTTVIGTDAVEIIARGNPLWDDWRRWTLEAFSAADTPDDAKTGE